MFSLVSNNNKKDKSNILILKKYAESLIFGFCINGQNVTFFSLKVMHITKISLLESLIVKLLEWSSNFVMVC